jgi:hypothetical protein
MEEYFEFLPVITVFLVLWIFLLTFLFYRQRRFYLKLLGRSSGGNLAKALEKLLETEARNKKELANLGREIENVRKEISFHIQKVGLVRFNPFNETGGDQSFSLAVLDSYDTGIVITGLHTRDRTRVYVKPVTHGKSRYTISKEERRAIKIAKK